MNIATLSLFKLEQWQDKYSLSESKMLAKDARSPNEKIDR